MRGQHGGVRRGRRRQRGRVATPRGGDGRGPFPEDRGHRLRAAGRPRPARSGLRRPRALRTARPRSASTSTVAATSPGPTTGCRRSRACSSPATWAGPEPHRVGHRRGRACAAAVDAWLMGATSLLAPIRAPRPPPALRISARRRVTQSRQRQRQPRQEQLHVGPDREGEHDGPQADRAAQRPADDEDADLERRSHGSYRADASAGQTGHEPVARTGSGPAPM